MASEHHTGSCQCGAVAFERFARGKMPDGTPMLAVNVNCLDGVDVEALPVQHFDGAAA